MSSSGGKKKKGTGADNQRKRIKCPQCDILMFHKSAMINHCYRIHFWQYVKNAPATQSELAEFNESVAEKKKKRTASVQLKTAVEKETEYELFGSVSDSVQLSTDDEEIGPGERQMNLDVEPTDAPSGPSASLSKKETDPGKKRWSPTPKPVNEPSNSCERK